jgi:phosphoglycerate dehydrogenase-like enzyme
MDSELHTMNLTDKNRGYFNYDRLRQTQPGTVFVNVVLTPHNAFNTIEAVVRKSEQSIQQVQHFMETGEFLWPVL